MIRSAIAAVLVGFASIAQAQVTGIVERVETHVATQQLRFYIGASPFTTLCSTANKEAYFPLTPTGNYTQGVIESLRQKVYLAKIMSTPIDVYSNASGTQCLVTDIVLR